MDAGRTPETGPLGRLGCIHENSLDVEAGDLVSELAQAVRRSPPGRTIIEVSSDTFTLPSYGAAALGVLRLKVSAGGALPVRGKGKPNCS